MEFIIATTRHQETVDITAKVNEIVQTSNVQDGMCNVFVPHATAAVVINENADPNISTDFFTALNKAFPDHDNYLHDKIDNNAGSHIKSAVLGPSETIPVRRGKLALGRWQDLWLVELDGPRERRVIVTVLGKG